MSQIKQLLLLHQQGKGKKMIARTLGMSKNTVKSYLDKLQDITSGKRGSQLTLKDLIKLENPELEAKFHPGNPAYKDDRYDHFMANMDFFHKELKGTGVSKRLLWEEYRQQNPDGYGYSQFCWHLQQQQVASRPSMVLEHKPAEKLFIDFAGKKLHYVDKHSGEIIECQVFVACLPYSDYSFAMAVKGQSTEDFLYALSCCLQDLGGVPQALVPDNLKAAVTKANKYEPGINRALEDFANHYRTTVVPARAKKPKDKALVENQVKLIYSRVYAKLRNMQFFDLHSLNEAIAEKVKAHNQTRMQQKPWCREEKFWAEEKKLLSPLPAERFEVKSYGELQVGKNNHIYLSENKHYYSVPYKLIGSKVKVIYTRSMVYIFSKGKQVAVHTRSFKHGGYTTDKEHLCSHHRHYRDRSPEYYLRRAEKKSRVLHQLITLIFTQNRYPEQLYKTCEGLLGLQRKTEADRFEKACQMAIDYQNYTYTFMKNILENKMTEQQDAMADKSLPKHGNLRGKDYYEKQLELKFNNQ
ncbi:MAG: IS21 family transposase [Proteobacteria bacterium]|nr:IS21 family transposase [Pseudomonadota bacterium]